MTKRRQFENFYIFVLVIQRKVNSLPSPHHITESSDQSSNSNPGGYISFGKKYEFSYTPPPVMDK